jgi:hypothetical protein
LLVRVPFPLFVSPNPEPPSPIAPKFRFVTPDPLVGFVILKTAFPVSVVSPKVTCPVPDVKSLPSTDNVEIPIESVPKV